MTSEKHFALSHTGFWNTLLPLEESYIRMRNLGLSRFAPLLRGTSPAAQHGIINETAFRLFSDAHFINVHPTELSVDRLYECAGEAFKHVRRLRQFSRTPIEPITEDGIHEALELASRLKSFFTLFRMANLDSRPLFAGCGWLDEAEADVIVDRTICEIKAGDRLFRGTDLRQVLTYCALNFSAKKYEIDTFILVNPRLGVYFEDDLETMARKTSGGSIAQILGEIVHYVSEPIGHERTI